MATGWILPVTDRLPTDAANILSVARKAVESGWDSLTAQEQQYFSGGASKGAYNYTDLNRVENNVSYLKEVLREVGYLTHIGPVKMVWQVGEFPTPSEMARYLLNIYELRTALTTLEPLNPLPENMINLNYQGANAIEQLQTDLKVLIDILQAVYLQCGTVFCGYVW
jgi:hypothetical protein